MTRKRKIRIGVTILFTGIVLWQFGLFNRYTYLTAKIAILQDSPKIILVGKPQDCGAPCNELSAKYGFEYSYFGHKATRSQLRGINDYNTEIENYLNKKNGKEWRQKYETELELLIGK